jgi:hypothetical protein
VTLPCTVHQKGRVCNHDLDDLADWTVDNIYIPGDESLDVQGMLVTVPQVVSLCDGPSEDTVLSFFSDLSSGSISFAADESEVQ